MVEQRWLGRTADGLAGGAWCTRGASGNREPRVSLASREETSGESTVSPAQGGRVLGRRGPWSSHPMLQSTRQREGWRAWRG